MMPTGTLKVLLTREHPARSGGSGFGFIAQDDGPDVFVLFSELEALFDRYGGEKGLWAELQKGPMRVAFKTTRTKRGLQATDVGPQTIERFRVAASEQYFRGGVPAPRLVLEHLYNGQVLADRAILFESEQDLSRLTEDPWLECSPELVLRIKERLGEYLARPVFTVFSSVRVPERLQFGEYSSGCPLTDDELRGLRVVATCHDQPGKRARISISVAPEGYADAEAIELNHPSKWRYGVYSSHSALQQLVGLGVVCRKACVACGFVLYTQDETQRVHRGEGLGSFCDDGLNGDLHQHRWEQMAEAASKRMGYGEPPDEVEMDVDFYFAQGRPSVRLPLPSGAGDKLWNAWRSALDPDTVQVGEFLLDGRCSKCGDKLVNDQGQAICSYCGHKPRYLGFDINLLACKGEAPIDPFAGKLEQISTAEVERLRVEVAQLERAVVLGNSLSQDHPRHVPGGDWHGLAYDLRRDLEKVQKALDDAPVRIVDAQDLLRQVRGSLTAQVGDLEVAMEYYGQIERARELVQQAEAELAQLPCPLCGQNLESTSEVGFTGWYCNGRPRDGSPSAGRHASVGAVEKVRPDRVLVMAVNERGEILAMLQQSDYAPRSHLYRGPFAGDVIHLNHRELANQSHPGIWDGVTPFESYKVRQTVRRKK